MNDKIVVKNLLLNDYNNILAKLLPSSFKKKDYLALYHPFLFNYFHFSFLKQDHKCVEISIYFLYKYLRFSLIITSIYKKALARQNRSIQKGKLLYLHERYVKQFRSYLISSTETEAEFYGSSTLNTANYLLVGNKPINDVSLTGTITGHEFIDFELSNVYRKMGFIKIYLDDCSVPLDSEFDDDVFCIVPGFKFEKDLKKFIGLKVQIKGKLHIDEMEQRITIRVYDLCIIQDIFHEIINHKIASNTIRHLENVEWVLPKEQLHIQEPYSKYLIKKVLWENYKAKYLAEREQSKINGLKGMNERYDMVQMFAKLSTPPELRFIRKTDSKMLENLECIIFLELLKISYRNEGKSNFVIDINQEFEENEKILKAMAACIESLNYVPAGSALLFFQHLKLICLTAFEKSFKLCSNGFCSHELISFCENIYIKLKKRIHYSDDSSIIQCHADVFIDNEKFLYILVKHVCYNYLDIRFNKDTLNEMYPKTTLEKIKIQIKNKVTITLYIKSLA